MNEQTRQAINELVAEYLTDDFFACAVAVDDTDARAAD